MFMPYHVTPRVQIPQVLSGLMERGRERETERERERESERDVFVQLLNTIHNIGQQCLVYSIYIFFCVH